MFKQSKSKKVPKQLILIQLHPLIMLMILNCKVLKPIHKRLNLLRRMPLLRLIRCSYIALKLICHYKFKKIDTAKPVTSLFNQTNKLQLTKKELNQPQQPSKLIRKIRNQYNLKKKRRLVKHSRILKLAKLLKLTRNLYNQTRSRRQVMLIKMLKLARLLRPTRNQSNQTKTRRLVKPSRILKFMKLLRLIRNLSNQTRSNMQIKPRLVMLTKTQKLVKPQ